MNFDEAFKLIDPIDGHMRPEESRWIYDTVLALPDKCRVLEVGVWAGRTTVLMALAAKQKGGTVWGIDPREKAIVVARDNADKAGLLPYWMDCEIEPCANKGDANDMVLISEPSPAGLAQFHDDYYDMVFIDGDHAPGAVALDIMAATRVLKPGGLLCGHDYSNYGVRAVVDYMVRCASGDYGVRYFDQFVAERIGSIWSATMTHTAQWYQDSLLGLAQDLFDKHKLGGASLRRLVENMRERMP